MHFRLIHGNCNLGPFIENEQNNRKARLFCPIGAKDIKQEFNIVKSGLYGYFALIFDEWAQMISMKVTFRGMGI